MFDDESLLNEVEVEEEVLHEIYARKRAKALEFLGKRWVLHPEYEHDQRHNQNGSSFNRLRAQ